ncbi:MAG TPA: glycoside hydrolase family 43 protein [Microbacterium sp.]|nr:glycoside hydrolase family 43 protein [Microbacterium sp.]
MGALVGCTPPPAPDPSPTIAPFAIDQDFADPDVLEVDGEYVAFAINTRGVNVQTATSDDLVEWKVSLEDALPDLPSWASRGRTWAPDVSELAGGGYVMYFTANHTASDKQCIGVATSMTATGPYVAVEGEPLVCPVAEGGAIDPSTFTDDDGARYLIWKTDGNCCALDTWLEIAPLAPEGTAFAGPSTKLFSQSEPWEGNLVEGPVLMKRGSTYNLFYSANDYGTEDYAVGVATAPSVTGPYTKHPEPILSTESSDGRFFGPGGQDVVSTDDGDVMVFHGWSDLLLYRGLYSVPLEWKGDVPVPDLP